jgi:hypothetical protein
MHDASIDWAFFDGSVGENINYSLPDDLPTSSFPTNTLTDEQLQELYGASIASLFNSGQIDSPNKSGAHRILSSIRPVC